MPTDMQASEALDMSLIDNNAYTYRLAAAAAGALGWGLLLHRLTPVTNPGGLTRLLAAGAATAFNLAAPLLLFGASEVGLLLLPRP